MEHSHERLHAIVEGGVQGVGYRVFVVRTAGALALHGWVRNRFDGSVEVMAESRRPNLDQFLALLRRGSRSSMVLGIHPTWKPASGEYTDFKILPTSY